MRFEIVLPPHTRMVRAIEVPALIALALYPRRSDSDDANDFDPNTDPVVLSGVLRYDAEDRHNKELRKAVSNGSVLLIGGVSHRPSQWFSIAYMTVKALAEYVSRFGVRVRVIEAAFPRLRPRVEKALVAAGVYYMDQLSAMSNAELLQIPDFGRVSLREVRAMLQETDAQT